jgi:hypothetical protein
MKKFLKITAIMAIIGIITAALLYIFVYNKPHPDYAKVRPKYTVEATELFQAFKTGLPQQSQKYTGMVIEITGNVDKIETVDSLAIAVMVFGEGPFGDEGIRCTMLPEFTQAVRSLSSDQPVRIKGLCTGFNDTDVILENCSISTI